MNSQRRNLYILTFVLFVVMLGYGIIIPILPFYIESMGAGGMELGLLAASYAVMRLIFGPIWGGLSDRVGRKPILLIGILGYVITMVWFGLATQLWMLFAARILAGILSSATAPTTMAYIGDSAPEEERGGGMGLLGAAGGVGTILGPAMGGFLADTSLSLPFFIAAGLALLSLILAVIFLPESYPAPEQEVEEKEAIIDLRAWWQALFTPVGTLFILTFISTGGLMIFANVFGLYGLERFGYGPDQVGIIMMVLGLVSALTQGLLAGPATKHWGDERVIKIGLLATALGFGLLLLANSFVTVILTTAFFAVTYSMTNPALLSLTSRRATIPQGIAMGLSNSFVSLGRIVGPILGGIALDIRLGLPYIIGAAIMLIAFFASLIWIKPEPVALEPIHPATDAQ
ncbi:MAG: Tetracycline resistance protein, class C [Anaerolineales bacterium]|nr:Tetracycline resistance protein, class C [Anaerolineales bacterium]